MRGDAGDARRVGDRLGDRRVVGDQPSAPMITWVAEIRSRACPRGVRAGPGATTVTAVTSTTPIISADAVVAVRPGWRIALRRASRPAEPPSCSAGRPTSEASPRTTRQGGRPARAGSASRSAATGGTRVARQAGIRAGDQRHQRADEHRHDRPSGCRTPCRRRAARVHRVEDRVQALATPKPTARPTAEASRPIASASSITEPRTAGASRRPSAAARTRAPAGRP